MSDGTVLSDEDLIVLGRVMETALNSGDYVTWSDDEYVDPTPSLDDPRFSPGICLDLTVPVSPEAMAILRRFGTRRVALD